MSKVDTKPKYSISEMRYTQYVYELRSNGKYKVRKNYKLVKVEAPKGTQL